MFKISWGRRSDGFHKTFVIVPDVYALFEAYWVITGYGRDDGASPVYIHVTNLDGEAIDMSKGLDNAASCGTYGSR